MRDGDLCTEYVLKKDGKYLSGVGYGGAGRLVPYWTEDIRVAKTWRTYRGAWMAAEQYGGHAAEKPAETAKTPRARMT